MSEYRCATAQSLGSPIVAQLGRVGKLVEHVSCAVTPSVSNYKDAGSCERGRLALQEGSALCGRFKGMNLSMQSTLVLDSALHNGLKASFLASISPYHIMHNVTIWIAPDIHSQLHAW